MPKEFYDERLHSMLQFKRPHNSTSEYQFNRTFLEPYGPTMVGPKQGEVMAYVIEVGDGTSKVLFSAHVDSVHSVAGKQKVFYRPEDHRYFKKDGEPLGADDAAGCWLLLEMIDAGVPGTYVFHRGEEKGGIGSTWMAENCSEWLQQFDMAIAFDRKATDSVITHQAGGRCCSDTFGAALAAAINDQNIDLMYSIDDTGVYTDTAEYTHLIPECTNLSCGYYKEHTAAEQLDLWHLFALRDACIKVQWHELPVKRDPSVTETKWGYGGYYRRPAKIELLKMDYYDLLDLAYEEPEALVDAMLEQIPGMTAKKIEDDLKPEPVVSDAMAAFDESLLREAMAKLDMIGYKN